MNIDYNGSSLVAIDRLLNTHKDKLTLTGKNLSLGDVVLSSQASSKLRLTKDKKILDRLSKCHEVMMRDVRAGVPVYGANSSFGGQAARVHNRGDEIRRARDARLISESLVFLDVGVGSRVSPEIVRAAMTIRVNMLMQGVSGVRKTILRRYLKLLNKNIVPIVNSYGGIGAFG
jgi:histidine ammonia-lyase